MRSPHSLLQAEQAQFPQPVFTGMCSSSLIIFVALLRSPSNSSLSFLYLVSQTWMQYSRWGLTWAEYRGVITSLSLLATSLLIEPQEY